LGGIAIARLPLPPTPLFFYIEPKWPSVFRMPTGLSPPERGAGKKSTNRRRIPEPRGRIQESVSRHGII
jgi:hypothetical protein